MARVFVNYRSDDGGFAAALVDLCLSGLFGDHEVFLASRTIEPGAVFPGELLTNLRTCDVLLAVIGPTWLAAKDQHGRPRLLREDDWVRRELIEAFARDITVIPILLDHTRRLSEEDLPEPLRPLATREYLTLRHRNVRQDIRQIARALQHSDARLVLTAQRELASYLKALSASLGRTQGWLPYPDLDQGYLDRQVSVSDEAPREHAAAPSGGLGNLYSSNPIRYGDVSWRQASREVPVAVLLGDAGYGKSWLLRHHARQLCSSGLAGLESGGSLSQTPVPIWTHAHDLARLWRQAAEPVDALLSAASLVLSPDGRRSYAALRRVVAERLAGGEGELHVCVDAYDEVFDDGLRGALAEALTWLFGKAGTADRGVRLILTSRPAGYDDPFGPVLLGRDEDDESVTPVYFHLGVLDEPQVLTLWRHWFRLRGEAVPQERLAPAMAPTSPIRGFARVPLIATFCAWVAEQAVVSPTRCGLFGQVVNRFLAAVWKAGEPSESGSSRQDPAGREITRAALAELAWSMVSSPEGWQDAVTVGDCERILARSAMPMICGGSRSRTFELVRRIGILTFAGVPADDAAPRVLWVHRSVHEYLVAEYLVAQPTSELRSRVDACWSSPEWADVLDFALGMRDPGGGNGLFATVRDLAMGARDGLGWFAAVLASAGLPADAPSRGGVLDRLWNLHRRGLLSGPQLANLLALNPETRPDDLVEAVLVRDGDGPPERDAWEALAWCGPAGLAALHTEIIRSPVAGGAVTAMYRVDPGRAVHALAVRLRAGLPVPAADARAFVDLPDQDVAWLRREYRRNPSSQPLARQLGWTRRAEARGDLLRAVESASRPDARRAAIAGLIASHGNELDEGTLDVLLNIALNDDDGQVRTQARDELRLIGFSVPWIAARLERDADRLYRDDTASELVDLDSLAARLTRVGPATVTALVMLEEDPGLIQGPVAAAMVGLGARALTGGLAPELIMRVATLTGADFIEAACQRIRDGAPEMPDENLDRLVTGTCLAALDDPQVFEAIAAGIARRPVPASGVSLSTHELAPARKIAILVRALTELREPNRVAVWQWSQALRTAMLDVPPDQRSTWRDACSAATRHVMDLPVG